MCPRLRLITILGIILLLNSLTTSVHARRKSRQDLPIENAADAPLEDNLATASGSDLTQSEEVVEVPNELRKTEKASTDNTVSTNAECNPEYISYELVTG